MNGRGRGGLFCVAVAASVAFLTGTGSRADAGWEAGLRGGADSNPTRAVRDGDSSGFLSGSLGYSRDASGDRRLDWTAAVTADGVLYDRSADLDAVSVTVAPGLAYVPTAGWALAVSPFLQAKSVRDEHQSALAWGARVSVQQQLGATVYLGEHYTYTDSRAREAVFSYREHAVGAYVGCQGTPSLVTEVGVRYAHGDSFRTLDSSGAGSAAARQGAAAMGPTGAGMEGHRGVQGLGGEVVRETVDTYELAATVGYSWTAALTSCLGYTFSVGKGSSGTAGSHLGYLGAGYRF